MKQEKEYQEPYMEVLVYVEEDVVRTSETGKSWPSEWSDALGNF